MKPRRIALEFQCEEYTCPITYGIFVDPVIASDGNTYERTAITHWLQQQVLRPHGRIVNPQGTPLPDTILTPNYHMRRALDRIVGNTGREL